MIDFKSIEALLHEQQISFEINSPLANYTSFKIGGDGRIVVFPKTITQIQMLLSDCKQFDVPYLILGNGSNVLVSDNGYQGVVLVFNKQFSDIRLLDGDRIEADAGASLMKVCRFACEHSLTGLEFAYGIPATVGGAVYMNAGAYGGEIKDVLFAVEHLSPEGELQQLNADQLNLSYRHSIYTGTKNCIVKAVFQLQKGEQSNIQATMEDILNRRKTKQPLEYPSAGSTFKRPPNAFAAKLIEDCGLKGRTVGGAQVSTKHSGFVINYHHASCQDVLDLIQIVQDEVKRQTGIELECEVKYIADSLR